MNCTMAYFNSHRAYARKDSISKGKNKANRKSQILNMHIEVLQVQKRNKEI